MDPTMELLREMDSATETCFGLVVGLEKVLGNFDLAELAGTTVFGGVPVVERDLYWEPKTPGEIKNGSLENSPHGADTGRRETTTGKAGREVYSLDVVNIGDFLFGGVIRETADGADAEVAKDDADAETAAEPDANNAGE